MQFTTLALSAATINAVLGAVYDVQLWAVSDDQSINGQGLSSIHEGAGINYFFLGQQAETLTYDDEAHTLTEHVTTLDFQVGSLEGILSNAIAGQESAVIDSNGQVTIGNSSDFWAAKNLNDPYSYSKTRFAVVTTERDGGIPLKIKAIKAGEPVSSSGYNNATTTTETATTLTSVNPVHTETQTAAPPIITSDNAAAVASFAGAGLVAAAAFLL